jgi:ABC-type dipeptide/oligopeptide/nickel transport system permease subunit
MDTADFSILFWFLLGMVLMIVIVVVMLNVVEDSLQKDSDEVERERLNKVMAGPR